MMEGGVDAFLQEQDQQARIIGMWGDVANCRVAYNHGVPLKLLRGLTGWKEEIDQISTEMSSENTLPLTWHYVSPAKMQQVHALKQKHPWAPRLQQMSGHVTNDVVSDAAQERRYWEALEKYVQEENARRAIPL